MPSFNLANIGSIFGREVSEMLPRAAEVLKTPAVPKAAARSAIGSAAKPVRPFAPEVSTGALPPQYRIKPEIEAAVSQTHDPTLSFEESIQKWKGTLLSAFDPTPNMPGDIKEKFLDARTALQGSRDMAARDLAEQLGSLKEDSSAAFKTTLMLRQMKIADTVAHMERNGLDSYAGNKYADWKDANEKLVAWVKSDPKIMQAHGNIRNGLDDIFNDMVDRGWIIPDRYLDEWTPMRKINTVFNALGEMTGEGGESLRSRVLSSMRRRPTGDDFAIDESNMLHVLHTARAEYYNKVAEHELFLKILNDPTLNLTEKFKAGQTLPRDVAVYLPGRGMVGSTHVSKEGRFLGEAMRDIDPQGSVHAGGWVLPRALVDELNSFHPTGHHPLEQTIAQGGRTVAKFLTVYNPANTMVNFFSDGLLAMMGLPGEKARPLGFLRWYPESTQAAAAFVKGQDHFVKVNGKDVNVTKLLHEGNIKESTLAADLSGRKVSPELQQFLPASEMRPPNPLEQVGAGLSTFRERVELQPRIAAGLAALEATGDIKEFGRVARQITLNFGAGSPKLSKVPLMRFMSPFITFQGLATERMFRLVSNEGSRGRALAAIASIPAAFHMWNTQNDEFEAANRSISSRDKSYMHFIAPDGSGHVLRDSEGNPVVMRMRYFVPEDVMRMIGLGNLTERVMRVAEGRDTPEDFLKNTLQQPGKTLSEALVVPNIAAELLSGRSTMTGKSIEPADWMMRFAPALRIPYDVGKELIDNGLEGMPTAAWKGIHDVTASRPMTTYTTMGHMFDADLREAIRDQREAQRNVAIAARKNSRTDKAAALAKLKKAIEKLKRIAGIIEDKEGEVAARRALGMASADVDLEWDPEIKKEYQRQQSEEMRRQLREVGM